MFGTNHQDCFGDRLPTITATFNPPCLVLNATSRGIPLSLMIRTSLPMTA